MLIKGGINICGVPLGVISLESYFPKPDGHIKHPASFDFPILYKTVQGATIDRLIRERDPELLKPFIEAAKELEREGVKAITGSCGFLALHQKALADAVDIPVFMSSLIQVPLVSRMLKSDQKVGVVVANSEALSMDHLVGVGIADEPLVVAGMQQQPQFAEVILRGDTNDLDMDVFEQELSSVVAQMLRDNPDVGAIVLECTDLSHFAPKLQQRFGLPVFDLTSLTRMVAAAVERKIA
ncbi:aspartate/glutamate racemase family protein [Motiliproteus coralliicola]|uniref:Aspartate/glutamate racemase family protein n=1 Tax=Motiliproteus coralliicola TaxID=2283196 RepID=A0A369WAM5_9GAMM|nr:aspartate/glutamate racemase family protein [Motiliproteus coralliicola]RDE19060.1 aspartate/glutamate racemase family protein [Motiliproteus coralliicola]